MEAIVDSEAIPPLCLIIVQLLVIPQGIVGLLLDFLNHISVI